jgi:hypothetical protein
MIRIVETVLASKSRKGNYLNNNIAMLLACFLTGLLLFSHTSHAQDASVDQPATSGLWFGLYTKFRMTDRTFYYAETHYRRRSSIDNRMDFLGQMGQVYNRHGISYLFSPNFELTAGPVLVLNYADPTRGEVERMTLEPRFWHQWLFIQPFVGKLKLYNQLRFEHRFRRSNQIGAEYQYTNRYRYKLFSYLPLNRPEVGNKTWFVSPSAEIFMQSGKSIVRNPFEDFRVYNTIGYIHNNLIFTAGHMWTYGQMGSGFEYRQSHVIRISLFVNLDFRRRVNIPLELNQSE